VIRPALVCLALAAVTACSKRTEEREQRRDEPVAPLVAKPTGKPCASPGANVCDRGDVVACTADGVLGDLVQSCEGACKAGACVDPCAVHDVELIYVVDEEAILWGFDPRALPQDPFRRIGHLTCTSASAPFSMSVDRKGIAWVLYQNGFMYRVSVIDGECTGPVYDASVDNRLGFGMSFVADRYNGERLFVAADDAPIDLAVLDVTQRPPEWRTMGRIETAGERGPELTGTGDGALYGFFPNANGGFIRQLDAGSARARGKPMPLGTTGDVGAYAFAHWGGKFYVFTTIDDVPMVHSVDRKTGAHAVVIANHPRVIVGAGVSTCAPLLERAP
jgi:hypothetical protein